MGKASKQRMCPAVGHTISPAECGENRISRYACPESCPFNPFAGANYEQLLAIEDDADRKTIEWLRQQAAESAVYERAKRQPHVARSGHGAHATLVWHLFFQQSADGFPCTQRWDRSGLSGLKNDERVLLRAKMQMRIMLLEIQRIIDAQTLEAVDLLAPENPPLRFVDRSLASRAARFSTLLGWTYPLPHFWRLSGTAIVLPDFAGFTPREIVTETVAHLGGPAEIEPMRRWLAEQFVRFEDALTATAHERRRRMFAAIDVQWCTTHYELRAPLPECSLALDAEPDVEPEQPTDDDQAEGFIEARVWLDHSSKEARLLTGGQGRVVLGNILLSATEARLQANSAAGLARLRELFEACLGRRVHFVREQREDFASRLAREEPAGDPALVVPRFADSAEKLVVGTSRVDSPAAGSSPEETEANLRQQIWKTYADTAIPALEDRTPREAARDPRLRPLVIELMKRSLRDLDERNLRTRRSDDLNWLVRELGLHEIDMPPPPPRAAPPDDDEDDDFDEDDYDFDEFDDGSDDFAPDLRRTPRAGQFVRRSEPPEDRRPAPMLSAEPFDFDEAAHRLQHSLDGFDSATAAMEEIENAGSTLLDDVAAMTDAELDEGAFSMLASFLLMAWFALVPRGARAPAIDFDAMDAEFQRDLESAPSWLTGGPDRLQEAIASECRQPMLLQLLMARMFELNEKMPRKVRPHPGQQLPMVLALKAVINAVDRALRRET